MAAINGPTSGQLELESLGEPPWLQEWLPDETLYSFVSRHHFWSGSPRSSDTCQRFFGHPREGSNHDFPARLGTFVDRTRGLVGDAASIFSSRTVLPYHLIFRTDDVRARETTNATTRGLQGVKARLGLLANRLGADHPLKVCTECMAEELNSLGVAYWHRDHQFPTVWICMNHQRPLRLSAWHSRKWHHYQWALPHHAELLPEGGELSAADQIALSKLADFTRLAVHHTQDKPWEALVLRRNLVAHILGVESVRSCRGLRRDLLETMIAPLFSALATVSCQKKFREPEVISRALGGLKGSALVSSPFWLLSIASVVLQSSTDFLLATTPRAEKPTPLPEPEAIDSRRLQLAQLISTGLAASKAGRQLGIAAGTAIAWAKEAGFTPGNRLRDENKAKHGELRRWLASGLSQIDAARRSGLSKSTASSLMRSDSQLAIQWRTARLENKRRTERQEWRRQLRRCEKLGTTVAHKRSPSTYSWLYQHDREWLLAINVKYAKGAIARKPKADLPQAAFDFTARDSAHHHPDRRS